MGDLLDCSYYLFKNELPHTTLYRSLLQVFARVDHSGKLASFFDKCKQNASYDSTTTVNDLLDATNQVIEDDILDKIRRARVIAIMSDEGTDINRHGNICLCVRYCDQSSGEPTETFITLLKLKNRDAKSIFECLVEEMERRQIHMAKIRFAAFDGAAVFSGVRSGVAARIRLSYDCSVLFIHCRAHVLQLAVVSASNDLPEVSESLVALKSLCNFINKSALRLTRFEDMQQILQNRQLKLVRPGDTRWLANSLSIRSVLASYESILLTLQHISNKREEDSPEALGLLIILSNPSTMFILYALDPILQALAILSKQLQAKGADFAQLSTFTSVTLLRLEELKDFSAPDYEKIIEAIQALPPTPASARATRSTKAISIDTIDFRHVFDTKVAPFINSVIENIRARFEPGTLALLDSFSVFDMQCVTDQPDYGEEQIDALRNHYRNDFDQSLSDEWRTFRKFLLLQRSKQQLITQREMCIKLIQDGTLKEVYPQLSLLSEIYLCAPISTATVEREFSTTNRILTDLRNRLTTEHVDQLMRISIEGPEELSAEMKEKVIDCWKLKKQRRLAV